VQSLAYSQACLSRKRTSFAKLTPRFYLPESFQKFLSNYFKCLGRSFFTFNPQHICSAVDGPRSLKVNARYTRFFRVTGGETTTHLVPARRTRQEKTVNLVWWHIFSLRVHIFQWWWSKIDSVDTLQNKDSIDSNVINNLQLTQSQNSSILKVVHQCISALVKNKTKHPSNGAHRLGTTNTHSAELTALAKQQAPTQRS